MRPLLPPVLAALCGLCGSAAAQTIQDIRDIVRRVAQDARYSAFLTALADKAEDGELSAGRLDIDGDPGIAIDSFVVPFRADAWPSRHGHTFHVEATVGYASSRVDIPDLWSGGLPGQETRVISEYRTFAGDFAVGPSFRLNDGALLQPLVHLGIAWTENDADYIGPGAPFTSAVTDGILFNWDGLYGSYGASLALRPKKTFFNDIVTQPLLRYDIRRTEALDVDDPALEGGDLSHWGTLRVDVSGPTGLTIADNPLDWQADIGYRYLFGDTADALGFGELWELGAGLGWHAEDRLPMISHMQLLGTVQFSEGVFGWSVGLSLQF